MKDSAPKKGLCQLSHPMGTTKTSRPQQTSLMFQLSRGALQCKEGSSWYVKGWLGKIMTKGKHEGPRDAE